MKDLTATYPDRFTGLGKFPGEHKLILNDNNSPVIHAPRRAPIQLRDKIKAELERMVSLDVIRPVVEPTDWVSSITYVQKADGSLRICLDPKDVNMALKRGPHHTPTVEELTHKFANATHFSKLDARSGYWSVQLNRDSQLLTTFNSPFGRYCFKRLPFGLKTSQDVFQRAMDQILDGLPGVISIADDITVYGTSEEDHDKNLVKLMDRAREKGLVFNPNKCLIKAREIPFFGNIYSRDGVRPDPVKIQAITDIAPPSNVTELQSFLGMITYLGAYIPNLSDNTAILRQLLHKDNEYQWHHEHQEAFNKLKDLVRSANKLVYFDPEKPSVIQVDASSYALGAALVQDNNVIAYASKSLTETEQRYANIEREMLACVFGAERFHTYIYGKPFVIESDHRPLEMISKKTIGAAPARLQRMLLRLQRYAYTIQYRPGKEMTLADSLSRLPTTRPAKEIKLDVKVCFILFSEPRLQRLREETQKDPVLSELGKYISQGFPDTSREIHHSVRPYWSIRDELSMENGILLKGKQALIPPNLQKEYLSSIHECHQGITRCQQRAKGSVFWPGINKDIENLVGTCPQCQQHQVSQMKEPLQTVEVPPIPWHTIGTDLFTLDGQQYLLIADYYTKYPIVEKLESLTSKTVTDITDRVFSMFGYPNRIISDNGPQFIGQDYQAMTKKHGIAHITSSPHHPKSHGFIERMVRSVKALFTKTTRQQYALLMFRATPPGANMPSPAEMMFGRKIQCNLPVRVTSPATDEQRTTRENNIQQSEKRYNESSKDLMELNIDDQIYYQDVAKRTWLPGVIIGIGPEPRSYTIKCSTTGRTLRRNRQLIRPRKVEIYAPVPVSAEVMSQQEDEIITPNLEQSNTTQQPSNITAAPPVQEGTTVTNDSTPQPPPTPSTPTTAYRTRHGRISRPPKRLIEQ
jgi:transposase InsO family protein